MDGYTFTAAAKALQVSRQTLYRYVTKEPDRYTTVTDGGQRRITLAGMALLKEQIQKPVTGRDTSDDTNMEQHPDSAGQHVASLRDELTAALHRADLLQVQLDNARERIAELEKDKATLTQGLFQAQELHRQQLARGGFLRRLFGTKD